MKLQRSIYDTAIDLLCLCLLVGVLLYLGVQWDKIPDKIPAHYNAMGAVDRWGSKQSLILPQFFSWLIFFCITGIERFPQIWNTGVRPTAENQERVYRYTKDLLVTEKLVMVALFAYITIQSATGKALSVWFLPLSLLFVFAPIVYHMWRLYKAK